jgi:hypothetical protein
MFARRRGDEWFLGAITDEAGRSLEVPLDFLTGGRIYEAKIFRDGEDADFRTNPTAVDIVTERVAAGRTMTLKLAPGGGLAVWFRPVED